MGFRVKEDNGVGFDDFSRFQFSQRFIYEKGLWFIEAKLATIRHIYPVQSSDTSNLNSSKLRRFEINSNLKIARNINNDVKLFGDINHSRNTSNRTGDGYSEFSVVIGFDIRI